MVKKEYPLIDKILGDWFKNIILLIVMIGGLILLIFALVRQWIGKDFGIELLFFIIGIIVGKWFESGKK